MKVIWSAASVRHLQEVTEYLQDASPGAPTIIRKRIQATVRRLGQMPYSGRVGRIDGTREAVVPRTPYIVAYRVSEQRVEILGVWHGARQWPASF